MTDFTLFRIANCTNPTSCSAQCCKASKSRFLRKANGCLDEFGNYSFALGKSLESSTAGKVFTFQWGDPRHFGRTVVSIVSTLRIFSCFFMLEIALRVPAIGHIEFKNYFLVTIKWTFFERFKLFARTFAFNKRWACLQLNSPYAVQISWLHGVI